MNKQTVKGCQWMLQCHVFPAVPLRFIDDFAGEWKRHSQLEQRRSRKHSGIDKGFLPKDVWRRKYVWVDFWRGFFYFKLFQTVPFARRSGMTWRSNNTRLSVDLMWQWVKTPFFPGEHQYLAFKIQNMLCSSTYHLARTHFTYPLQ